MMLRASTFGRRLWEIEWVKGRGEEEGVRVPAPREEVWGENTPVARPGDFAQRVRVPRSAPGEESKQQFLNQSAHACS